MVGALELTHSRISDRQQQRPLRALAPRVGARWPADEKCDGSILIALEQDSCGKELRIVGRSRAGIDRRVVHVTGGQELRLIEEGSHLFEPAFGG